MFGGNTNTNTFGTGNIFGQTPQQPSPQQPQQPSGVTSFGGWAVPGAPSGFTTPGTNMFGTTTSSPTTKPSIFGTTNNSTTGGIFGTQQNSTPSTNFFGGSTTTTSGTTNFFTNSSSTNSSGTPTPFEAIKEQDTVSRNGVNVKITVAYQCITMMSQYKDKSLEQLRFEDYQLNRHKKSTAPFGTTSTTTTTPPVPPPPPGGGGLFGSLGFGQNQSTNPWPSTTQNTNTGATTSTSSGLFNMFSNTQQKPSTNLFGSSSTFGQSSTTPTSGATTASSPFTFGTAGTTTTSQGQGQTTNLFGTPPTTTQFNFGQSQGSTTGTGTSGSLNLFGNLNQNTQPQPAKPTGFNFTVGAATVTTTSPGLFGGTTSTTKPLFGTGTSGTTTNTPPPTSTGLFSQGGQNQQQTTTTNLFGNFGNTANKSVTFGGTTSAPAQPSFGSTSLGTASAGPSTSTSSAQQTSSFGFNVAPQQPAAPQISFGSFGGPSTSGTTGSSFKMATAPGTFGSTGGFVLQPMPSQAIMLQGPRIPMYQHPQYVLPGPITFGTSAYKDSPLFYNLHENAPSPKPGQRRKRLDMPPADEEAAKKYVSKSSSHHLPQNFTSLPLFRRQTSLVKGKNSSISKFKIFDGFEDEDFGVGIDILSPKTDVKKLNLQTLEESFGRCMFPPENRRRSSSSPSLARRSTELISEKNSKDINSSPPEVAGSSSTPILGNRRVRFLLPPKPGQETDDDEVYDEHFGRIGSRLGSSSASILENGGAGDCGFLESSSSTESIVGSGTTSITSLVKRGGGGVCGLISTRDSYYVKPSVRQLNDLVDTEGNCFVEGFEIGRRNFGRIKFLCPVNVKDVNIDELVNFRHKEVVVYPDDSKKPGVGQGLNVPAEIRLERVWPVDKETNELIRGVENIKQRGYEGRLKRSCKRMGVEFVGYDGADGIWCFRVNHF